ncbi:HAD family hydrolase [Candidatus Woesearchaeota archaeon]|nr:HAD family hydrolase [Candidatus Woesearchaeota archaeon]
MLLIFDIDGVLADFTKLRLLRDIAHIQAVAKKHNISQEQAKQLFHNTKENNKMLGKHSTIDTMLSLGITKQEFYTIMNSAPVEGNIIPANNAQSIIKQLSEKHKLVALTNTPYEATSKTLQQLNILQFFANIYAIDKHNYIKPSQGIFKQIILENNAAIAVSIGDSFEKDLAPAKTLGLKTVLFKIANNKQDNQEEQKADYTITDLHTVLHK